MAVDIKELLSRNVPQGEQGFSGISGYSGFSGYSGYSGSGVSGYSGMSGYSGRVGSIELSWSATAPTENIYPGYVWYNTETGVQYVYVSDGDSFQWVESANPGISGFSGYSGVSVPAGKTIALSLIFGG